MPDLRLTRRWRIVGMAGIVTATLCHQYATTDATWVGVLAGIGVGALVLFGMVGKGPTDG